MSSSQSIDPSSTNAPYYQGQYDLTNKAGKAGKAGNSSGAAATTSLIDQLMALGTGADMAFIVYAMQIDQMNKASNDSLKDIQQTSELRDVMSKHLSKLRDLQALVNKASDSNGNANFQTMIIEYYQRQGKTITDYEQATTEFWSDYPMYKTSFSLDANGKIETKQGSRLGKPEGEFGWNINKDIIKAEVDNISDDIKQLDADREIKMIMFNGLINKKSNAVTQLSNLIKTNHEMDKSIISNLR